MSLPVLENYSAILEISSAILEISSAILEISSELVQISFELVQISFEQVCGISELLIISTLQNSRKSVSDLRTLL